MAVYLLVLHEDITRSENEREPAGSPTGHPSTYVTSQDLIYCTTHSNTKVSVSFDFLQILPFNLHQTITELQLGVVATNVYFISAGAKQQSLKIKGKVNAA